MSAYEAVSSFASGTFLTRAILLDRFDQRTVRSDQLLGDLSRGLVVALGHSHSFCQNGSPSLRVTVGVSIGSRSASTLLRVLLVLRFLRSLAEDPVEQVGCLGKLLSEFVLLALRFSKQAKRDPGTFDISLRGLDVRV